MSETFVFAGLKLGGIDSGSMYIPYVLSLYQNVLHSASKQPLILAIKPTSIQINKYKKYQNRPRNRCAPTLTASTPLNVQTYLLSLQVHFTTPENYVLEKKQQSVSLKVQLGAGRLKAYHKIVWRP